MLLAVFFRGLNARIDRLAGVGAIFGAALALADGYLIGALLIGLAGASLFWLTSAKNPPLFAFGLRVLCILVFLLGVYVAGV